YPQDDAHHRLADRPAGAVHARLGTVMELDCGGERAPGREPGLHVVHDRDDEERSRWRAAARPRDGPERVRGLRRSRYHRPPDRVHRRTDRIATGAVLPWDRLRHRGSSPVVFPGARYHWIRPR